MSKQFHNIETIAPLQENVVAVWSVDTKEPHSITPDLLIPNGYVQLVFVRSGSYKRRKLSSTHNSFTVDQSVIIGIQNKVTMSQNIGELKSIGLQFDPMQFYHLFGDLGISAGNKNLLISESGQDQLIRLNEKICKTASIAEALREIENFFIEYRAKNVACKTSQRTKNCLQYMRNKKGNTTIEQTAKFGGINTNTLSINFNKFVGFAPEEMIEIIKTASTYIEPPINESTPFLSIKDLFDDMEENESGEIL